MNKQRERFIMTKALSRVPSNLDDPSGGPDGPREGGLETDSDEAVAISRRRSTTHSVSIFIAGSNQCTTI